MTKLPISPRVLGVLLPAALLLAAPAALLANIPPSILQARSALQHGKVDEAERTLRVTLSANPQNADAHQLLCRVFYAQDEADKAVAECEAAAAAAPNVSANQMWLGRAYGLQASHVNPLSAFTIARKVCAAFEHAVQDDSSNVTAMNDLGEFYVAAPGIVGGGTDKAQKLASTMMSRWPSQAHRLLAYIADSRHDTATAEAEFKAALAAAPSPETYIDLGHFYQKHKLYDQAVTAINQGIAYDHEHGPVLVDAASILVASKRALDIAEQALRAYIASPDQTDDAPVFKAHYKLGNILAKRGDKAGARQEYAAALALAANFAPAQEAMKGV